MGRDKRKNEAQDETEEKYKGAEHEGLPRMEPHIGPFVVAPDRQKEERWNGGHVGECGNGVVGETGVFGTGHDPYLSDQQGLWSEVVKLSRFSRILAALEGHSISTISRPTLQNSGLNRSGPGKAENRVEGG